MKRILSLALVCICLLSLAACSGSGKTSYTLGNADRARVFFDTYNKYVENYGEAAEAQGKLSGAAVVRLYDFTGDGILEMLIAYSSEKNGTVDKVMVCGFDMGFATLYDEKITSKSSADAKAPTLWVYTDSSNLSYLVFGEDLSDSRSYLTYQQADAEGNPLYAFAKAFDTDGADLSGAYEKFDITGADFKAISAENENVLDALETQKN